MPRRHPVTAQQIPRSARDDKLRVAFVACALLLALLAPCALAAQAADSVTVVAGPQYAAPGWQRTLLGSHYRDRWTAPIRVPVLDLRRYAGGLTPVEIGGGMQTITLHFQGADGQEYIFRSVDKDPKMVDEPALRNTPISRLVKDQTSSLHPGGALVVPPLLEAVGVPHPTPVLYVMPNDPALGEFREQFAGMLGTMVVKPNEGEGDTPGFGGYTKITGTEKLLERLEEDSDERIDAPAYLTARLVDLVIGDWDRNPDNWRWAGEDSAGARYWVAVPRDRDYAMVDYDGLVMAGARQVLPNAVRFTPTIVNVYGLTLNARPLDRRLLAGLDRAAWDSVTAFVQRRLTDAVIDSAIARLPLGYREIGGAELASTLRSRRNSLGAAAREFYDLLSTEVDVEATDKRDIAFVDRLADGSLRVRVFDADKEGRPKEHPYFERLFAPEETNEVRLFMHGGADQVTVHGGGPAEIAVRVLGGGGDDVLTDSTRVEGTAFYDDRGVNRFVRGPQTEVSTYPWEEPDSTRTISGEGFRDWGSNTSIVPSVGWHGPDGPIVGAGINFTRYGFRMRPYAYSLTGIARVGLRTGAIGVELLGDFPMRNSADGFSARLLATQLHSIHYYGLGNETLAEQDPDFYTVRRDVVEAEALYRMEVTDSIILQLGPVAKYVHSQQPPGTPYAFDSRYGRDFGQVGALAELTLDTRDQRIFPNNGTLVRLGGSGYPDVWSARGAFGEAHAVATGFWTPALPLNPTLALRVGGQRAFGEYPVFEAAFLGGSSTLPGYPSERFAGDASFYGATEMRVPVDTVTLLVRGELGVLGLASTGRVFLDGESSNEWHNSAGAGVYFRFGVRGTPLGLSATYVRGEVGRVYVKLDAPL